MSKLQEEGLSPSGSRPGLGPHSPGVWERVCGQWGRVVLGAGQRPVLALGPPPCQCWRRRLEGSRQEEGAPLPSQPEVQGGGCGRPRLPPCRAGCQLGSKTALCSVNMDRRRARGMSDLGAALRKSRRQGRARGMRDARAALWSSVLPGQSACVVVQKQGASKGRVPGTVGLLTSLPAPAWVPRPCQCRKQCAVASGSCIPQTLSLSGPGSCRMERTGLGFLCLNSLSFVLASSWAEKPPE